MEKKIRHEKVEECNLCGKVIHTDRDLWKSLVDLTGSDILSVKFYHHFCFNDLVKAQGKVIEKNFADKVNAVVKNLMKGVNQQLGSNQVYEIK